MGCIPSKTLLESSEQYHHLKEGIDSHGIHVEGVKLDLDRMMARKEDIVLQLTKWYWRLVQGQRCRMVAGSRQAVGRPAGEITHRDGSSDVVSADNVIIATGSVPIDIGAARWTTPKVSSWIRPAPWISARYPKPWA